LANREVRLASAVAIPANHTLRSENNSFRTSVLRHRKTFTKFFEAPMPDFEVVVN
jgi:hypothetical protein